MESKTSNVMEMKAAWWIVATGALVGVPEPQKLE